ncbi:hypothetical protein TURU_161606 [Turdus rufiventris]|nr:hypothetical protein TURU_161606 [Turdus rufiventris]
MYAGFGGIILDFISSFFLSFLNNSLIPAIIKAQLNTQSQLYSTTVSILHPHSGAQHCFQSLQGYLPINIGRVTKALLPLPLLLSFGTMEFHPELDPQAVEPHSELDPQTNFTKEDEEKKTMKVQANNSDDCSVKNDNTTKEHRPIQPNKQTA